MLFTAENAAEMQAKAQAAMRAKKLAALAAVEQVIAPQPEPQKCDTYVAKRLARVRKQIDILSDRMEELLDADDLDAQAIDRVASALDKLGKLEQVLAGRPGPGNRKPAPDRPNKRNFTPEPQPVVVQAHKPNDPNEPNG